MGAYVSIHECPFQGINLNCTVDPEPVLKDGRNVTQSIGGLFKGQIPPDGDIAGIGIVGVFVGVTSFALALSAIDLIWIIVKAIWMDSRKAKKNEPQMPTEIKRSGVSFSGLCEAIILSCSDQQVFTGGAYAVTLRYTQGCFIRAYHYNIVANMMLLTCATHLMSITLVRDYWRYPWLALVRIIVITLVFLVTGMLLANQNGHADVPFPTAIPNIQDETFLMFRHAACFQDDQGQLQQTLGSSFTTGADGFMKSIRDSTPGNHIQGWNWYLCILLWYAAAIIVDVVRFFKRGLRDERKDGWRSKAYNWLRVVGIAKPFEWTWLRWLIMGLLFLYLAGGVLLSGVTVGFTAKYIMDLRAWARESGWLEEYDSGKNTTAAGVNARLSSEDIATAFGQMVPIFLCLLTVFTFAEKFSEMANPKRASLKYRITGSIEPGPLSRTNTLQSANATSSNSLPTKTSPQVQEKPVGVAMTPGLTTPGMSTPGIAMTPGVTPMTPGFPGAGHALDGTGAPIVQSSPYASQVRFSTGTGSTPLLAGSAYTGLQTVYIDGNGSYFPATAANGSGRHNSTISATSTLNNAATPGSQVVVPIQGQQIVMPTQQFIPTHAMTVTPPPMATSGTSPSPPIGVALGVPAAFLQQPTQAAVSQQQPVQQVQQVQQVQPQPQPQQQQQQRPVVQQQQPTVVQQQPVVHQTIVQQQPVVQQTVVQQPVVQQAAQQQAVHHQQHNSTDGYFPPQSSTPSVSGSEPATLRRRGT